MIKYRSIVDIVANRSACPSGWRVSTQWRSVCFAQRLLERRLDIMERLVLNVVVSTECVYYRCLPFCVSQWLLAVWQAAGVVKSDAAPLLLSMLNSAQARNINAA